MTTYEIIEKLCDKEGIAVTALETKLRFGRGSIGKLKNGGGITATRLKLIADHFGVTVDYLMTGEDKQPGEPQTPDIGADLNETVAKLSSADTLMFNGMELDEETRKLLLASVESLMANANMMAKIKSESKPKEE